MQSSCFAIPLPVSSSFFTILSKAGQRSYTKTDAAIAGALTFPNKEKVKHGEPSRHFSLNMHEKISGSAVLASFARHASPWHMGDNDLLRTLTLFPGRVPKAEIYPSQFIISQKLEQEYHMLNLLSSNVAWILATGTPYRRKISGYSGMAVS